MVHASNSGVARGRKGTEFPSLDFFPSLISRFRPLYCIRSELDKELVDRSCSIMELGSLSIITVTALFACTLVLTLLANEAAGDDCCCCCCCCCCSLLLLVLCLVPALASSLASSMCDVCRTGYMGPKVQRCARKQMFYAYVRTLQHMAYILRWHLPVRTPDRGNSQQTRQHTNSLLF